MIYVGIVGALTPVGQKVSSILSKRADVKIVFREDDLYQEHVPLMGVYNNLETALMRHEPSVVIDCCAPERAAMHLATYKFYEVTAILCGFGGGDFAVCCDGEYPSPSVITAPDFSVRNTRLIDAYLRKAKFHAADVKKAEITVTVPEKKQFSIGRWLYAAAMLNEQLGIYSARTEFKGDNAVTGKVVVSVKTDPSMPAGAENLSVHLYRKSGVLSGVCHKKDYAADAAEGIEILLDWYASHPYEMAAGKLFSNHLSKILRKA